MILSVVIPTHGRPQQLADLIADIAATRNELDEFEVVVVVDGRDETPLGCLEKLPTAIACRGLTKDHAGPAAARNHAIAHARGRWLLFLDDDVRIGPDTIPCHVRRARVDPDADRAWLGRLDPPAERIDSPWSQLLADTSMVFFWNRMRDGGTYGFRHFWTVNLSVRRDRVLAVGGFDERFPAAMHEDIELGWRLQQCFGTRVHADGSIVGAHDHPLTPRQYVEREHASGVNARHARSINAEFHDAVWPWITEPETQLAAVEQMLLPTAQRALAILLDWSRPSSRRPARETIEAAYLAHLPLKRLAFLGGYAGRPLDTLWASLSLGCAPSDITALQTAEQPG